MKYYHGSSVAGLDSLNPFVSNHEGPFVYVTTNEVIASFYMVKNPWYTYGFDQKGTPSYTEYYKDSFLEIYKGKTGYLYECKDMGFHLNPTNIHCAFVCEENVPIIDCIKIEDVYERMLAYEKEGLLIIERFEGLSLKQLSGIKNQILNEIKVKKLWNCQSEEACYVKEKFPEIWKQFCDSEQRNESSIF